jgi:O-antigen/teichoic acid export membrane protein
LKIKKVTEIHPYKKFSIDAATLVGTQILIALISLANSIVMVRALGVEDRGFFVMALLLPGMLIAFSDFGIPAATTKFSASDPSLTSTILIANKRVNNLRILIIFAIGILIIYFYGDIFFTGIPKLFLYLGLIQALSTAIQGWILPIYLGLGKGVKFSLILLGSSAFMLFVLVVIWLAVGLSVELALLLTTGSQLIFSIYVYFSVRSYIDENGKFSKKYFMKALRFGSGIYVSGISLFINDKMILFILNIFGGVIYVSLYTIAQALCEKVHLLTDGITTMLMPKIAEDPLTNSKVLTVLVFKLTMISSVIVSGILMLLSEWLIVFMYTQEFYDSIIVMQTLLVAVVFKSGWTVISQDLNARELTRETGAINMIVAILSLCLAVVLLSVMGLVGAALAAALAYMFAVIIGLIIFINKTDGVTTFMMFYFSAYEKRILQELLQPNADEIN